MQSQRLKEDHVRQLLTHQVTTLGDVALNAHSVMTDLLNSQSKFMTPSPSYKNFGALGRQQFGRG